MNALNQVPGRTQQRGRSQYPADSNTRPSALAGIYREGCSDALERSRVVWSGSPTKPAKQFVAQAASTAGDLAIYRSDFVGPERV